MNNHINFHPHYNSNLSAVETTIDKYGANTHIHISVEDLSIVLDDVLSDWYSLSKEQQDKLRELFHDPVTFEE